MAGVLSAEYGHIVFLYNCLFDCNRVRFVSLFLSRCLVGSSPDVLSTPATACTQPP